MDVNGPFIFIFMFIRYIFITYFCCYLWLKHIWNIFLIADSRRTTLTTCFSIILETILMRILFIQKNRQTAIISHKENEGGLKSLWNNEKYFIFRDEIFLFSFIQHCSYFWIPSELLHWWIFRLCIENSRYLWCIPWIYIINCG